MASINVYKAYSFRTKDPIIDKLRTIFQDEGLYNKSGYKTIHERGAATTATYNKWFNGGTRRPSHPTVAATISALGYETRIVKKNSK